VLAEVVRGLLVRRLVGVGVGVGAGAVRLRRKRRKRRKRRSRSLARMILRISLLTN
jgi:hypothetical protein